MADINLSAAVRQNLISLNKTTDYINRSQTRLATGLKVNNVLDDAVAYFQAKSLTDRAEDLAERKNDIDQGISTLKTATQAIEAIDKVVKQMKGLLMSAKTADATERQELQSQFNELARQVNTLAADATYQGLNLVNSTGSTLKVSFSEQTDSFLEVKGVNVNASALMTGFGSATALATNLITGGWTAIGDNVSRLDAAISEVDSAISTLRGNAKTLGSNVALLQTRLDFTEQYVNALEEGAGKLTLADLNEEGANVVALQTRQQLGLQSLAFAGQTEQAVLSLFR